jgi:hypothetical protein
MYNLVINQNNKESPMLEAVQMANFTTDAVRFINCSFICIKDDNAYHFIPIDQIKSIKIMREKGNYSSIVVATKDEGNYLVSKEQIGTFNFLESLTLNNSEFPF